MLSGDWVDRGAHQVEVVLIMFALKVMYPARVYLVRGNHEFKDDCMSPLPFKHAVGQLFQSKELHADVCHAVYEAFSYMPISALINRKILVVHGGIGNGEFSLDNLRHDVPRPLTSVFDDSIPDFIRQVLWSDPTDSDDSTWNGTHGNSDRWAFIITLHAHRCLTYDLYFIKGTYYQTIWS
jgi:diadenosine tetraphosphatase ApaH/serine/threonine PP2A family protein phosphatase